MASPFRSFVAQIAAKLGATTAITGATNASPIVITAVSHGLATGSTVSIQNVGGNTAANGTWTIIVTGVDTFSLTGSTGNSAYTSGGTVTTLYGYPVAGDVFAAYNWNYEHTVESYERQDIRGNLMKFPPIPGARMGKISFSVDLKGSGTAGSAPEYGECFKGCGMSETIVAVTSVTYKPVIAQNSPISITVFADGQKYAMASGFGTVKLIGEVGKPWRADFEFTGQMVDPADVALLGGVSFDSTIPPSLLGSTVTFIGVVGGVIKSLNFDLGAQITMRQDINQLSGYKGAHLTDRKSTFQGVVEAPDLATHDLFSKQRTPTTGVISHTAIGSAGNLVQVLANVATIQKIGVSQDEGRMQLTVDGIAAGAGSTTEGDDLKVVLT